MSSNPGSQASLRQRYLGLLGLICKASLYVPEDIREQMERALQDACNDKSFSLEYSRTLERLDIHVLPPPPKEPSLHDRQLDDFAKAMESPDTAADYIQAMHNEMKVRKK